MNVQKETAAQLRRLRDRYRALILVLLALAAGISLLILLVMRQTERERALISGQNNLHAITEEAQNGLDRAEFKAESIAQETALVLETLPESKRRDAVREIVHRNQVEISEDKSSNLYQLYMDYEDELIIDDFQPGEDYILSERVWNVGARKKPGQVYFTMPYVDAVTGKMCYTVSLLLPDDSTVVGLDYTVDSLQSFIEEMDRDSREGIAMIVDEEGMIIAHSDASLVGTNCKSLPYADIVREVYTLYGKSFSWRSGELAYHVFSDRTDSGWYLVYCLDSRFHLQELTGGYYWVIPLILALLAVFLGMSLKNYRNEERGLRDAILRQMRERGIREELASYLTAVQSLSRAADGETSGFGETVRSIQERTEHMSAMLGEFEVMLEQPAQKKEESEPVSLVSSRRQLAEILIALSLTGLMILGINTYIQIQLGGVRMAAEASEYETITHEWGVSNSSLVNDLAENLSLLPGIMDDYETCRKYLDDRVGHRDDIAVAYLANPQWEPSVIMNNGWIPGADYQPETRPWYQATMASGEENGFSVSAPYLDAQTGKYCVTISRVVYDRSGRQLCVLGVDYYIDQLVEILGDSYSDSGYAFLVDREYRILNHPNSAYQMTADHTCMAGDVEYRDVLTQDRPVRIRDYDGKNKIAVQTAESISGFSVIAVVNWTAIYGSVLLTDVMIFLIFLFCILVVVRIVLHLNRTQEAVNQRLVEAAQAADSASRAKSDFLASMSHEIRTPLNTVLGMNEMIRRENHDPTIAAYASNIENAGRMLLSLINDVLDFSKMESGKMELTPVSFQTASMLNNVISLLSERAREKDLNIVLDIDETLPASLIGDDVRIRQVLTNLLTNAVKYTREGSVTLSVQQKKREDGSLLFIAAVKDTGIGIRQEDLGGLFDSFSRMDSVANRHIEGTGLGLAITKSLVQRMEGTITVDSVYGKGTTFTVSLPLKVENPAPMGSLAKASRQAEEGRKTYQSSFTAPEAKVLVVDDNRMNLKVFCALLKKTKLQITTASSGKEALSLLRDSTYDLIFLDHMMPELDGIQTLHALREDAQSQNRRTPAIALTANAIAGAERMYLDEDFVGYLSKPVVPEKLERTLIRWLPREKLHMHEDGGQTESQAYDGSPRHHTEAP